jgi:hypothetical protein
VSPACFPITPAHVGPHRQLVSAVAHGHERAAEQMAVDGAPDLHPRVPKNSAEFGITW